MNRHLKQLIIQHQKAVERRILCAIALVLAAAIVIPNCVGTANAGKLWAHVGSEHAESGPYNEFNPGLAIETDVADKWAFEFGFYENSFYEHTNYFLVSRELASWGPGNRWGLSVSLGAADGYDDTDMTKGDGVPVGGFLLEYRRARLLIAPKVVTALSFRLAEW